MVGGRWKVLFELRCGSVRFFPVQSEPYLDVRLLEVWVLHHLSVLAFRERELGEVGIAYAVHVVEKLVLGDAELLHGPDEDEEYVADSVDGFGGVSAFDSVAGLVDFLDEHVALEFRICPGEALVSGCRVPIAYALED